MRQQQLRCQRQPLLLLLDIKCLQVPRLLQQQQGSNQQPGSRRCRLINRHLQ
jgi:hypothetical protein